MYPTRIKLIQFVHGVLYIYITKEIIKLAEGKKKRCVCAEHYENCLASLVSCLRASNIINVNIINVTTTLLLDRAHEQLVKLTMLD